MKLAVIRRRFSAVGGAELYAQRLIEPLIGAGHEVHLLTEHWETTPPGLQLHLLPANGRRSTGVVRFADAVEAELARHRFDCVLSLDRTRKQDVYRAGDGVHQVWLERRRQFASWWRRPFIGIGRFHRNMLSLEQQTFDPGRTGHIIVNSRMVQNEISTLFGFPADRIHLVRNGIEVDRCRNGDRKSTRARYGLRSGQYLLLFVGSGWERKGLKYLLAGVERLASQEVELLVLGKGQRPLRPPANVIFADNTERVENAYAAADVFTLLPIYEPCANVCSEALAAGLPVITSRYNGASELIQAQVSGTVVDDPSDTAALIEAIRFWMTHRDRRPVPIKDDLTVGRNVAETLAVLELAAKERRA